jgi:hypothetical protein
MGPQWRSALLTVADLEGQAEAFAVPPTHHSDFELGFINRTVAARLRNAGYLLPFDYAAGEPLRLTAKGREYVALLR